MTSIPMSEIQNTTSEWFWPYCESMLTAAAVAAAAVNLQSRPIPIAGTRRLPDKSDFNGELELQWSLLGAVCELWSGQIICSLYCCKEGLCRLCHQPEKSR